MHEYFFPRRCVVSVHLNLLKGAMLARIACSLKLLYQSFFVGHYFLGKQELHFEFGDFILEDLYAMIITKEKKQLIDSAVENKRIIEDFISHLTFVH